VAGYDGRRVGQRNARHGFQVVEVTGRSLAAIGRRRHRSWRVLRGKRVNRQQSKQGSARRSPRRQSHRGPPKRSTTLRAKRYILFLSGPWWLESPRPPCGTLLPACSPDCPGGLILGRGWHCFAQMCCANAAGGRIIPRRERGDPQRRILALRAAAGASGAPVGSTDSHKPIVRFAACLLSLCGISRPHLSPSFARRLPGQIDA
jgi:hypothetical protein